MHQTIVHILGLLFFLKYMEESLDKRVFRYKFQNKLICLILKLHFEVYFLFFFIVFEQLHPQFIIGWRVEKYSLKLRYRDRKQLDTIIIEFEKCFISIDMYYILFYNSSVSSQTIFYIYFKIIRPLNTTNKSNYPQRKF